MYWLTFLALSLALYLPPFNLAQHLWRWAAVQEWHVLLVGWPAPASRAYAGWLALIYLATGTALHFVHVRLAAESRLGRLAVHLSRAGLGSADALAAVVALAILFLAWPVLPVARAVYGWRYGISVPVAALAALYLLAEALRLVENNILADRAFAARRTEWLIEHGHHR